MKKKVISLIAALALVITAFCVGIAAFDGNDYDYGGSDWGGSDYDSDWGSSSNTYVYYGGGDDGDGGGFSFVAVVIVVIIIIFIISATRKNKNSGGGNGAGTGAGTVRSGQGGGQGRNVILPDRTAQIEQIIKAYDPNFTASDFETFAKQVYMDIEDAWCKRDLTPVRPVMHDNLYNTTKKQVQSKIDQGVIYHYESIAINTAYLTSFAKDAQFEYLTMYLNARMIDYQTDEKTGNIIRGDRNTRWDMRYKMKFMRSVGILTKDESGKMNGNNCPNCGAPLEITSSGHCQYCGSEVTTGKYSWVLSDFTTIRNDTVDEGIKLPPQEDKQ